MKPTKKPAKAKLKQVKDGTIIRVSNKTVEWIRGRAKFGDTYDTVLQRELSIK